MEKEEEEVTKKKPNRNNERYNKINKITSMRTFTQ